MGVLRLEGEESRKSREGLANDAKQREWATGRRSETEGTLTKTRHLPW